MKKRKNIAIPMILAATIAAVSVPCSSQIVMASDTYQVGVSKGYLALRSAMAYDSSNEIGELYSGDTVEYKENTKSDYCECCGYDGEIQIKEDENGKLIWECPNCGNQDQDKLFVARRTCGYIGTQFWNQGRTQEIKDRVLHL